LFIRQASQGLYLKKRKVKRWIKRKKENAKKSAYVVRPCMYTNFMTTHIFFYQNIWILNATRANDEEGSTNIFWTEVIEEFPIIIIKEHNVSEIDPPRPPPKKMKLTGLKEEKNNIIRYIPKKMKKV
jgi:hypothetical protein